MASRRWLTGSVQSVHFNAMSSLRVVSRSSSRKLFVISLERNDWPFRHPVIWESKFFTETVTEFCDVCLWIRTGEFCCSWKLGVSYDGDSGPGLEGAVGLDDMKSNGAESLLCDFQDGSSAKKREVPGIMAETFEMATEWLKLDVFAVAGSLNELGSMKNALPTLQSKAKIT